MSEQLLEMARRGRPRRNASVARLVDKAEEKEEDKKAKKLGSKKEQQQTHETASCVVTPGAAGKASMYVLCIQCRSKFIYGMENTTFFSC